MSTHEDQNGGQPVQSVAPTVPTDPRLRKGREGVRTMYVAQPPPLQSATSILMPPPPPPPLPTQETMSLSPAYYTVPPVPSTSALNLMPNGLQPIRIDTSVPPPPIPKSFKRTYPDVCPTGPSSKCRKIDDHLQDTLCENCIRLQQRCEQMKKDSDGLEEQNKYKKLLLKSKRDENTNLRAILRFVLPPSISSTIEDVINGNESSASLPTMELSQTEELFVRFLLNASSERSPSPEPRTSGSLSDNTTPSLNGFSQFVTGLKNDGTMLPTLSTLENLRAAYASAHGAVSAMPALAAVSTPAVGAAAVASPAPAPAAAAASVPAAAATATPAPSPFVPFQPGVPPPTYAPFQPAVPPPPYAHFQPGVPPPPFAGQQPPPVPPFAGQHPPYATPLAQPPQAAQPYAMTPATHAAPPYPAPRPPPPQPQPQPSFAVPLVPHAVPSFATPQPPRAAPTFAAPTFAAPQPQPQPQTQPQPQLQPPPPRPASPYGAQHAYYPHPSYPSYQ